MLFEREPLTPQKKLDTLTRLFHQAARRGKVCVLSGHVPVAVMEAHGELDAHVRFILEAASRRAPERELQARLRKIEKLLDSLPEAIMTALPAGPDENWLCLYRRLVQLHGLLREDMLDAEEYAVIVQKMAALAGEISRVSAVEVNGASMFTLLLLQVQLQECAPRKVRRPRKKKRKKVPGNHGSHSTKSAKSKAGL